MATISGKDEIVLVELQNRVHVDHTALLFSSAKQTTADVHECLQVAVRDHLLGSAALL